MDEARLLNRHIDAPGDQKSASASPAKDSAKYLASPLILSDRFEILDLIAAGGTSYVHRARDLLVDEHWPDSSDVAIKVTRKSPALRALGPEFNARIIAYEAQVARRLAHPSILRVFDFHRDGGAYYLSMEYVPGEPLSERLKRAPKRRLPYGVAVNILIAVADALATAHRAGVVHADLKPGNILLAEDGTIKLIDFANARPINGPTRRRARQASGYVGYSPAYASLETLRDLPATPSDDVYSLACIVYEMLSGFHPFDRKSAVEASEKKLRPERPDGMGVVQWWILRKALGIDARSRFQDIAKFSNAFRLARRTSRGLLAAAVIVVVGGLGLNLHTADRALQAPIDIERKAEVHRVLQAERGVEIAKNPIIARR